MPENPTRDGAAWILALDDHLSAAVGEREMAHLLETPTLLEVPLCPPYCRQVLIWNDTLLPAMDLSFWLRGQPSQRSRTVVSVLAYQKQAGMQPEYGALLLSGIPTRVRVTDELACALPQSPAHWRDIAISCFRQGDTPIPILDLPRIFSGAF